MASDALEIMEQIYGIDVMDKFYVWHGFKKGGTPGGKFTGIYFFLSILYFFLSTVLLFLW